MRKRNTVLVLGITSILILISVQVFIISGIWKQKNEMFALRYTILSKEALSYMSRRTSSDGFDTVRFLLRRYSEEAVKELHETKDENELAARKKDVLDHFTFYLNHEQDLSGMLSEYFNRRGFEKNFNYSIVINNLEIISNDTINLYRSENFANRRSSERTRTSKSWLTGSRGRITITGWFLITILTFPISRKWF